MRCWILYDSDDLKENTFFAQWLQVCSSHLGMESEIVTTDSIDVYDPADIVISRTRDYELTALLEDSGATVFNRSSVSRICNDKAQTYSFVRSIGIPILDFSYPGGELPRGPPWVVKSRSGHGGTEVFKADTEQQVSDFASRLEAPIIQEFAGDPGKDLRVYVLGGRIIASVLRSSGNDFRANFKLGGKAELVEPGEEITAMVRRIIPELMADFIGIDFVFSDGRPYLNEIEDVVGTRMLYKLTDLDPADMYCRYIARCMNL